MLKTLCPFSKQSISHRSSKFNFLYHLLCVNEVFNICQTQGKNCILLFFFTNLCDDLQYITQKYISTYCDTERNKKKFDSLTKYKQECIPHTSAGHTSHGHTPHWPHTPLLTYPTGHNRPPPQSHTPGHTSLPRLHTHTHLYTEWQTRVKTLPPFLCYAIPVGKNARTITTHFNYWGSCRQGLPCTKVIQWKSLKGLSHNLMTLMNQGPWAFHQWLRQTNTSRVIELQSRRLFPIMVNCCFGRWKEVWRSSILGGFRWVMRL